VTVANLFIFRRNAHCTQANIGYVRWLQVNLVEDFIFGMRFLKISMNLLKIFHESSRKKKY